MMDSPEGYIKLSRALNTTPEGQQLFKDLKRFKLDELIGNKIQNDLNGQLKLQKFSNLLQNKETQAILKRLVGNKAYNEIRKLQSISGKLQESASKFLNASQSGTTVADVGLVTSAIIGLFTGNPWAISGGIGGVISLRLIGTLLSDPVFLKHLEKAVTAKTTQGFNNTLKTMQPIVEAAIKNQQLQGGKDAFSSP